MVILNVIGYSNPYHFLLFNSYNKSSEHVENRTGRTEDWKKQQNLIKTRRIQHSVATHRLELEAQTEMRMT